LRPAAEALAKDLGAEDRIHMLGSLPHDRVKDLLRAADCFVQTSLFEGQSNSILEAMHEGLPIICSDIPTQRGDGLRRER
jgi:glycosyltransferase involved in cell wall biosynthesis